MDATRRALLGAAGVAVGLGNAGCLDDADIPEYDCSLDDPPEPVLDLPQPTLGDPGAPVTVEVFEDFGCPVCAAFKADEFPAIREELIDPGEALYVHWDLPAGASRWSVPVANGGRGVHDRLGDEAFFEYAAVAYEIQESHSADAIGFAAEEAGDEPCAAVVDAEFGTYDAVLTDNQEEALDRMGRDDAATPAAFVDGERVDPTADAVIEAVSAAR